MATQFYSAVCKKLGFDEYCRFVTVRRFKGKILIGFTCGKPDEIRSLLAAVERCKAFGYFPTKGLLEAANR